MHARLCAVLFLATVVRGCPVGQVALWGGACAAYPTPDNGTLTALLTKGAGVVLSVNPVAHIYMGQVIQVDMYANCGPYALQLVEFTVRFPNASANLVGYNTATGFVFNPSLTASPMVKYDTALFQLGVSGTLGATPTGTSVWLGSFQIASSPNLDFTRPPQLAITSAFLACTTLFMVNSGGYQYVTQGACGPYPVCPAGTSGPQCAPCPQGTASPAAGQFNQCLPPATQHASSTPALTTAKPTTTQPASTSSTPLLTTPKPTTTQTTPKQTTTQQPKTTAQCPPGKGGALCLPCSGNFYKAVAGYQSCAACPLGTNVNYAKTACS